MRRWFRRGKHVPVGDYVVDTIDGEIVYVEVLASSVPDSAGARPVGTDSSTSSFRSSSRGAKYRCSVMKVVLPDSSELELPDGATGLDAARAIGPKLAEQAVLVALERGACATCARRSRDGERDPDPDHARQADPDALYVLRHSTAHLLAEAVRRLYPGVKIAIGPPIENGFYYDFEFPEPIHEADLERIEAEMLPRAGEGREWSREEISRDDAQARFEAEGEPYKVELVDTAEGDITLYTQGDFTDLCRGPHLQDSKPIKAVKLTGLAGAYWRGDEKQHAADPDLRHRLLRPGRPRRPPRGARGGPGARPPQARAAARPLPPRPSTRPARRSGTRRAWCIWNVARGPPPPREPRSAATSR